MNQLLRGSRLIAALLSVAFLFGMFVVPNNAIAGTTGTISGTVRDAKTGAPIADVKVTAAALTQTSSTRTNAQGFYVLQSLTPDTYTVSFEHNGFQPVAVPGVTVQQDQVATVNQELSVELKTIAAVHSASASNLVKGSQGSDVYSVSGVQQHAVTGGDNTPKTLYEYLGTVPGVTINGAVGTPRIRGGDVHDIGYEFDGIPLRERLFGIFTSNISSTGIGNIEVYTGGLPAADSSNGTGIINSVVKTGTYPGQGVLTLAATGPDHNNYLNFEYGGQSQNRKFSYYAAYGRIDSSNDFNYGAVSFPDELYAGYDGPGPVKERDLVGNFHYRPDSKNDFQFLVQNGVGEFTFDYLLHNPQPKLTFEPCSGATFDPTFSSYSGGVGGTAPNGAACPNGLYWGQASGGGNMWHHYSGIGKLQWNHIINDHSLMALRVAENFNQYIFDQPMADPNDPTVENPGGLEYNGVAGCPAYPYTPGTPVLSGTAPGSGCAQNTQAFYGDRKSHMWFAAADYTNTINQNLTFKAGIGQEYDVNLISYALTCCFNPDGTWPNVYTYSDSPTHIPYAYADATMKFHKLMINPGLRWQREWYGLPANQGGSVSVGLLTPSFNGTYQFNPANVLRFSYGMSTDYIGSAYISRSYPHGYVDWSGPTAIPGNVPNPTYNPAVNGASFSPERNVSSDLMFEHQFAGNTTVRFGPWYNSASNYYENYTPVTGYDANGKPILAKHSTFATVGQHKALGFELALNHIDTREYGLSYFLSATYDNYWTTEPGSATSTSPLIKPAPTYFQQHNIYFRDASNPLFTASLTAQANLGRFELIPQLFYQYGTFYALGNGKSFFPSTTYTDSKGIPQAYPTGLAGGWWIGNFTWAYKLDPKGRSTIGVRVKNFTDQEHGTTPCWSYFGTGCWPLDGPYSGVHTTPKTFIYQNVTTDPRRLEVFWTTNF